MVANICTVAVDYGNSNAGFGVGNNHVDRCLSRMTE